MEQEILTVRFDGQNHQIDVQTFAYSVLNFATVIKETNKKLDSGKVDIHIKAPERGSVVVQLLTTVIQQEGTLLPHQVAFVGELVTAVGGLYKLHQFVSGRKTKKTERTDDSVRIELDDGSQLVVAEKVYNIYANTPAIPNGISQHFAALNEDPAVSKFEVSRPDKEKIIEVDREDYARLAIKQQFETENSRTTTESAHLYIYKVVFDRTDRKWEFYYNGNRISASITDDEFYKSIDGGEAFAKGDQLRVDIQVNQIFDETVGAYINQSFQVVKVYEHIKRSTPIPLPFDKKFGDEE